MTNNLQSKNVSIELTREAVGECLMCPPDAYQTSFLFNPWLDYRDEEVEPARARRQWNSLVDALNRHGTRSKFIEPSADSPAMVFTADGALVYAPGKAMVLRNDGTRSTAEPDLIRDWLRREQYLFESLPPQHRLDGGNILRLSDRTYLVGLKPGSPGASERYLARILKLVAGATVLPLALADRMFLHLDMVVGNLAGRGLLVYWEGLHAVSREHLLQWAGDRIPLIEASEHDAKRFACNTVATADGTIVTGPISDSLAAKIERLGLGVERIDLSEFYKAGGGAKCLTLPTAYGAITGSNTEQPATVSALMGSEQTA